MQLGRYGTLSGACLSLIVAGIGMIWPNDPTIGQVLVAAGLIGLAIFTLWWVVAFVVRRKRGTPASAVIRESSSLGDININAQDSNTFGNVGHQIKRN